jgi:hypothetical protein
LILPLRRHCLPTSAIATDEVESMEAAFSAKEAVASKI